MKAKRIDNPKRSLRTIADTEADALVASFMRIPRNRRSAVFSKVMQAVPHFLNHRAER